ncbi:MAG: hypothetical protein J6B87_00250 [Clostridia bacterium]|nr:hypothetical protein [Clostridia bacterium]
MKKANLIFILIITLLVLLSSNVSAAVSREEFEIVIGDFIRDMAKYNDRFLQADNVNDDKAKISYENRTVMSEKISDTAMFFTDDSFISYVFKEVSRNSLNMKNGDKIYSEDDIYNNLYKPNKTDCKYFTNDELEGERKIYDENAEFKVISELRPGDILIDKYWTGLGIGDTYIYLGRGEFACFKGGNIVITDAFSLSGVAYDIARISESALSNITTMRNKFDSTGIQTDAMSVKDALENLELKISIDSDGNIVLKGKGGDVSQKQLVTNIREGFLSTYGSLDNLSDICFQLEYSDENGNKRNFGNGMPERFFTTISKNTISSSNKVELTWFYEIFDFDDYKSLNYTYWASDYFSQENHSLYIGIYIYHNDIAEYIKIMDYPVQNGKETVTNGVHYIDCFSALTNEKDDGTGKPTLQEFLDYEMVPPAETYKLNFNNVGENQTIDKDASTGMYKTNPLGEILFTVNKSGTYVIKDENSLGESYSIYLGRTDGRYYDASGFYVLGNIASYEYNPIRCAGIKTEGACEDSNCINQKFENGEYLDDNPENSFPLVKNTIYVLDTSYNNQNINQHNFTITYKSTDLVELRDHEKEKNLLFYESQSNLGVKQVHIGGEKELTLFERLEYLLSFPVRNMANGIIIMTNWAVGKIDDNTQMTVSIDSIVFDNYPLTQLSLFTKNGQKPSKFIEEFVDVINRWYSNFTLIAIVVYLIILLYMGIRIALNSTAAKQAIYKELFMHWVTGLVILFTFPTVIRYAIKINTAFVDMIEQSISGDKIDNSIVIGEYIDPDQNSQISTKEETSEEAHNMELNPFSQNDDGYMAVMARRAHVTKRLSYAFIYLIMAFQLLIIVIMYYKRLFMVVFLLVLFPLVMIAHVLEKVADIKTGGAFAKWTKEILITIFVQSIHAIIYSFSISTVISAGNAKNDWILMLVGVTFLFNGEAILKKILGQSSEATPSLAQTATKTVAVATAVTAGTRRIADNVVGAQSHLGKTWTHYREQKLYKKQAKAVSIIGEKPKEYKMPDATNLKHFNSKYVEVGDAETIEVANAIQVINNIEYASPAQISHAMNVIENAKESGNHQELLKDLKMSDSQFEAFQIARNRVAEDTVKAHKPKQQIDMELTMELERIFPAANTQVLKAAVYSQIASPLVNSKANMRDTSKEGIRNEIENARQRYSDLKNRIRIADDKEGKNEDPELLERAAKMLHNVYGANKEYTAEQYQMALSVAMLQNVASGKYDAKELMTSANFVYRNQGENKEFARMASAVGGDIEDLRHVLAYRITQKAYSENYKSATDQKAAKQFTGKAGSRLDDARKMADKVMKEYEGRGKNATTNEEMECPETVTVSQIMEQEFKIQRQTDNDVKKKLEEHFENTIQEDRKKWNTKTQVILSDFSAEMMNATNDVYKPKINGMTKEELQDMSKIERNKKYKEGSKAVLTTAYSALAAPMGAGLAIGLSDDEGIITEAIAGGLGAATVADTVVETAMDETIKKKVKMRNPYTGEMEEVEVTVTGAFADSELTLTSSEISAAMSSKLKEQFLKKKLKRDEEQENKRQMKIQAEQAKKRLDETYKRLMTDKNNAANNNNNSNNTNT